MAGCWTTDFFPPLVDDPADFGAIAAANACSDVFAMGGRVVLALNISAFPERLPPEAIAAILREAAEVVNVHDFPQDALGRAVPYGLYDLLHNRGTVYVGSSADTPQFAVEAIARWWDTEGCGAFPQADQLLILADAGGSNGCRPRQWKYQLQAQVSDRFGLTVTVCHYPTGCSKWNPIEHRLFSHISLNWAGKPLRTWDTMLGYIRGTTTTTGLEVHAFLHEGVYETGQSVSDADMHMLHLERHALCPNWNYTIRPHRAEAHFSGLDAS